jgi:hypothetical protein
MLRRLVALIGSVRFFILMASLLAIGVAVATVVPQAAAQGPAVTGNDGSGSFLIEILGLNRFYSSPLFLTLGALLELSLLVCALPRIVRRATTRAGRNLFAFAPDIIHLGLIALIAGGAVSFALRERSEYVLPVGSRTPSVLTAPNANPIAVVDAGEIRDEAGLLLNWYVSLDVDGTPLRVTANHPVRHDGVRYHFMHFEQSPQVVFADGDAVRTLVAGEGLLGNEVALILTNSDDAGALFAVIPVRELEGGAAGNVSPSLDPTGDTEYVRMELGESLGPFRLVEAGSATIAGFSVSRDPGRPIVLAGLLLFAAGMILSFLKRWRHHG